MLRETDAHLGIASPRENGAAPVGKPEAAVSDADLTLFELGDVKKRFGSSVVLERVSLAVAAGTTVAITGGNGAGKTTLLRIAAGVFTPDSGTVELLGLEPRRYREHYQRCIGFLAAGDRALYARLSVRENLRFWAALSLLGRREAIEAVERAVSDFRLEDLIGKRVDRLSMGQRQRVRLAMTFLHRPRLVLLDEPRNSLDETGQLLLLAAVKKLAENGGAAIWCSPSGEAKEVAFDAQYVLEGGRLLPA